MDTETNKQKCQSDEAPTRYGFDSLPQELVVDIASRLPITSLVQFKFVRKSFYRLSHDPELVNLHLSRAVKNDPCIIFLAGDPCFVELSDLGREKEVSVSMLKECFPEDGVVSFYRQVQAPAYINRMFAGNIIAFEFGFSPVTKEYKVIKITYEYGPRSYFGTSEVQVFSLSGNSWRSIGEAAYQIDSQGIMLNGKMHWLTRFGMYNGCHDRLIVSFDLADEVFAEVPKVDFNADPRTDSFHLAVLGGSLAVAITLPHQKGCGIEIWVMKEYNVKDSWVKEYIIGAYTPTPISVMEHVKVLCLLKNGDLLVDYRCGNLVAYDPQNAVFRPLKYQGMPNWFQREANWCQTIVHVGGLNWIGIPPAHL
ncbi:PREDICTED: F-box protein At3g07870-like [Nicotiana attenuata]|uniref:F-box protein n=1 Tax=Nicotiana attenuata TaxID=49451 RepID=A0A1J6ITT5_NICAT|nr:PREDICTED: F-box protein At3g07870-like [Nicotiana attenuata]OIT02203.1 f-box protein [Nicotiana attenuata]